MRTRINKNRVFSFVLSLLMAVSLLPASAIQVMAAGGTVDDYCGTSEPAKVYDVNLNPSMTSEKLEAEIARVAEAGYNDTVNISVTGTVELPRQLFNDKGATINLVGQGAGACLRPAKDGLFTGMPVATNSPIKQHIISFGTNASFESARKVANSDPDRPLAIQNITLEGSSENGKTACGIIDVNNHKITAENTVFQKSKMATAGINIKFLGETIDVKNCQFLNNEGSTNSDNSTPGLYLNTTAHNPNPTGRAKITGTTFSGNRGHSGGALYAYGDKTFVHIDSSCKFENNYAGQRGGAILSHATVYVDGATFTGNQCGQFGGTFYISANEDKDAHHYGTIILNNVNITGSQADGSGGGGYIADNGALFLTGNTKIMGNTVPENGNDSPNNVFVQSVNSKVICTNTFTAGADKVGISTGNPYSGKDVVVSPVNVTDPAPNYKLAKDNIPGYNASYDSTTAEANVKSFKYDGEGFTIVDDPKNAGMMMLQFNSNTSDVVFDFNIPGAEAITYPNQPIGTQVSVPQVNAKSDSGVTYKFQGWYTDAEGGEKITTPTVETVAGLRVYYAHWEVDSSGQGGGGAGTGDMYLVYFDQNFPNGGSGLTASYCAAGTFTWTVEVDGEIQEYSAKLPFALPEDPARPGYQFLGWATTADAKAPDSSIKDGWVPQKETTTLFGVWEPEEHTLTWNANGGQGDSTTIQSYDETLVLPTKNPTREGYTFTGWYMNKGCSVAVPGDMTVDGDRTFYAGWTAEKVVVNYYDTREGTSLVGTQEYRYGDALTSLDPMEDTAGQTFIRWETKGGAPSTGINQLTSDVLTYQKGTGGDGVQSDAGYWTLDFYSVWEEQTTDYIATIHWNDLQDNDGCRPKSIHLGLISSVNNREVAQATVANDGKDMQTHTFQDLPITTADSSVEKITYSVYLKGYSDCKGTYRAIKDTAASSGEIQGATSSSYDDAAYSTYRYAINNFTTGAAAAAYSGSIYLDHDLITTRDDLKFTIQWDDQLDNDGKRPRAVTLVLYANGVKVQEEPMHNTGSGVVSASPSVCMVNKDGDAWTYVFQDYQKYSGGKAIDYTVAVVNDDQKGKFDQNGYTTKYLNSENEAVGDRNGAIISRPIDLVDKTVTIHWDDSSNRDNLRPDHVTVTLTAYQWNRHTYRWEQKLVDTATIQGDVSVDTWSCTFKDVKRCNGGQEIIYEAAITSDLNAHIPDKENGYTTVTNQLEITASHNQVTKSVPVKVEWDDHQNNDTIRPKTVILQLYADGKKLEGANYAVPFSGDGTADTWTYTFENLPVYRNGKEGEEILYTFSVEEAVEDSLYGTYISTASGQEEEIVRYTASYMGADGETTDDLAQSAYPYVKLSHATDQGTINLYASWHDEKNQDGKRPTSIQVDLYKQVDGQREFIKTYTVTAGKDGSWTYKVSGLPLYEEGHQVTYLAEVSEDFRQNLQENYGYTVSMEGPVVHLYYTPAVGYVTGHILWSDNEDNDSLRPDTVKGTLYANGKSTGKVLEFNRDNHWTQTWNDVASYYNNNGTTGTPVVYSIAVEAPDGYEVSYVPESTTTIDPQPINITLRHEGNTTSAEAKVYWNDNADQDGKRPDAVTIQLYGNGKKVVGKTLELTGTGDVWTGTFTGLPVYEGGKKVDYTIQVQDSTAKAYTPLTAGMNLYLSRDAAVADMSVSFRFNDGDNADGTRPEALYLTLTANGEPVSEADYQKTVYFDVDGVKVTFQGLPVYAAGGQKIAYNAAVSLDQEFGSTDYTVLTSQDITLSTSNTNQVVVTLKRSADVGTETGHVYWFDANNQRGNRPESIVIDVRSDAASYVVGTYTIHGTTKKVTDEKGTVVGSVEISEWGNDNNASCWTYTIGGLTQNAIYNGQAHEIYYYATARTPAIANWYTTVDGQSSGLDINLTHKNYVEDIPASKQNFRIDLSWLDNDNAWNYRPDSKGVDVTLYANGTQYKTIHLTQANVTQGNANAWTYTFADLPTYLNGSAVVWSAQAEDVKMYTSSVSGHSDFATITMTQSIGFDLTTHWADSNDDDAARPSQVTVEVYGDGAKVGEVTLSGQDNTWTGAIADLAVWRESGASTPVSYSFQWSGETEAQLIDNYYAAAATQSGSPVQAETFYYVSAKQWGDKNSGMDSLTGQYQWETTLTRDKETTSVHSAITWNDDGNRDGLRPDSILLQLYANGTPVGQPKTLTGGSTDSSWSTVWEEMDVFQGGKEIIYTVQVVTVPQGYDATPDATGRQITLTHEVQRVAVTGTVHWDDSTELRTYFNSKGEPVYDYEQISRVGVYVQLLQNGQACGEPIWIPASEYGQAEGKMERSAARTWNDLYKYAQEGKVNEYTMRVFSNGLDALLQDGHTLAYNFEKTYEPGASITHDLYDVRGTVHYLYNTSDEFLLAGVPVTAYLYDEDSDTYRAVGSAVTDRQGKYELKNLPQGRLTVRATYQYGDYTYAGSTGVYLDRRDNGANLIVQYDGAVDGDRYRYTASGKAFFQTDRTDSGTTRPVPEGSIVLLYQVTDDPADAKYLTMTTTAKDGSYAFHPLANGSYLVNVVFNYNDGTYTYDNSDAVRDGLSFVVRGGDVTWSDIIKQVNEKVEPGPEEPDPEEPDPPVTKPEPCVVSGDVFFSDKGVHTADPVTGVDVAVYAAENNAEVARTTTDAKGHWSAEGLGAGEYIAVFSLEGNTSRVLKFTITERLHETGAYTAQTQYFERNSGQTTSVIRGVVLDDAGNQTSALVQILDGNGNLVDLGYTDNSGAYGFVVPAEHTYRTKILKVDTQTKTYPAGDPDDALTALDHYTLTGSFVMDGKAQLNCTVVLYQEGEFEQFDLRTATLTNGEGKYTFQIPESGNYRIVMYRDGKAYDSHYVTVGYQEYEPAVTESGKDTYTISGQEAFDTLTLWDKTTSVTKKVAEQGAGTEYAIQDLPAGTYLLQLTRDGATKSYYIDAPEVVVDVDYFVTISGVVEDASGQPVLGAVVTLQDSSGKQVGTETVITDGRYAYRGLPADTYTVTVRCPVAGEVLADKTTKEPDSFGQSYPDGIEANRSWVWNINAVTVSGSVTDQAGNPISGAAVILKQGDDPDQAYGVLTDENGRWSAGVMAGSYTISAMYEFDLEHIYHGAKTVNLSVPKDQDVSGVDLVIQRHHAIGTVVRSGDDKPISGAKVTISYQDGPAIWTGTTDANGAFDAPLFPDDYTVQVQDKDASVEQTFTVENQDVRLALKLAVPITITGTVYESDGKTPVEDGIVYYTGKMDGKVFTGKDGTYAIQLTADQLGVYTLYASAAGKESQSIEVTVISDTRQDLILTEGGEGSRIISGVVTDNEGNRLANAVVKLVYGDDKTQFIETSTDQNGQFRCNVADGTYYITALYQAENGYCYETNGETAVHVDGKDKTNVTLAVTLSYAVDITVVDAKGEAVSGAAVTYQGASDGTAKADKDGKVMLQLAGGEYDFQASIGNRKSDVVHTTVDKAHTKVTLTLGLTGIKEEKSEADSTDFTLSGTVLAPDGDPVEGASVKLYRYNLETATWVLVTSKESDGQGYYEFTGLASGTYRVDTSYQLTEQVQATPSAYEVSGYAKDPNGNPYDGAVVNLYLKGTLVSTVTSREDGQYVFSDLKPGAYVVEVIPAGDEGDHRYQEEKEAQPGSQVIAGTVVDVNGNPVQGATVTVRYDNGSTAATTTQADGKYLFAVTAEGTYTVTIRYPDSTEIRTDGYKNDPKDPIKPDLTEDSYVISGYVHDTDDNVIAGADVILKDKDGKTLQETKTDGNGYYVFLDLKPGDYIVQVIWGEHEKEYPVAAKPSDSGDPGPDQPDPETMVLAGTVVTDHKTPLPGAEITLRHKDTGKVSTLSADRDGRFDSRALEKGVYEVLASYTHTCGVSQSAPQTLAETTKDTVLVIILSYTGDVNGDGKEETVYAGPDDRFDTKDDWYPADPDQDGKDEPVAAGEDGKPGTADDSYPADVNHDGKDEEVFVGTDRIPGTEDDYYLTDPDKDGQEDKIYAGEDGKLGTKDDFYEKDPDADGENEKIYVGEDTKPGTKDDWYLSDPDKDGEEEKVFVGEDGIPGTKDDWYLNDDGDETPIDVVEIHFNANGGRVNGSGTYTIAKSQFRSLPSASRSGYTFDGWFTAADGGTKVREVDIRGFAVTTTVYAHWSSSQGSGDIGGGGGVLPPAEDIVISIQPTPGVTTDPSGEVTVEKGEDLTITITPDAGYKVDDVLLDGKSQGPVDQLKLENIKGSHEIQILASRESVLTGEHIAYISGYPDGSVQPEANITRAEVAMIFYRLLTDEAREAYEVTDADFTDVPDKSWYETAVATLANLDILNGYSDGSFQPNKNITRAEFAAIASRFDDLAAGNKTFSDVPQTHWAYNAISSAAAKGWVNGYSDGSFQPDKAITRAETMTLVNRVLGRDTLTLDSLLDGMKTWPDNANTSIWYYLAVQEATNAHDMSMEDGKEVWTELTK